jgi:hypothetical protein
VFSRFSLRIQYFKLKILSPEMASSSIFVGENLKVTEFSFPPPST